MESLICRPPRGGVSRNIGEFTCDRIYEFGRPPRGGVSRNPIDDLIPYANNVAPHPGA